MRKISELARNAFYNGNDFRKDNTRVEHNFSDNFSYLYLHGNCIAKRDNINNKLYVNHCGYTTNTTKERLNGLYGVSIYQRNYVWYLNGVEMLSCWNEVN